MTMNGKNNCQKRVPHTYFSYIRGITLAFTPKNKKVEFS